MASRSFKLGDWISVQHQLTRKVEFKGSDRFKVWVPETIKSVRVVVVGERLLKNGITYWDEYGYSFHERETIPALLVCSDMRRKPFFVLKFN